MEASRAHFLKKISIFSQNNEKNRHFVQTPVIARDRLVCDKLGIHMKTMWKNEQNYETFSDITNPRQDRSGVDENL